MSFPAKATRKDLLERGWYVVTDVGTAFLGLSGRAHDLLIVIKHLQGDKADAFPTQRQLAESMKKSVRTIQRTLDELVSKGALAPRRTGRANRYSVNFCHATIDEIRILLSGNVIIPAELVTSDTTGSVASDTPETVASSSYKEPPFQSQNNNPLPSGEAAAQKAQQGGSMSWKRNSAQDDEEFNPGTALGLWSSQEIPDDTDDPAALFPAPRSTTQARRSGPTQAQLDTPYALATELDHLLHQQPAKAGPAPVNRAGLARNIAQWKRDGITAEQIRSMMATFIATPALHRPDRAPWINFVAARYQLLTIARKAVEADALETSRDNAETYFLGSLAPQPAPDAHDVDQDIAAWNAA
ncbi:helix-turn-helix domain-containing protein [Streptomyces sp. NPDC017448]|uniref:helix-turn-helix domain-containing protein n=1 Tax=Streptomyces sp. NPDC017448 TaxID=3364996 RepID=UPI0037A96D2C